MKRTMKLILTLSIISITLLAQTVPALINYQGKLTDASGNPLATDDYTLTFSVYDAATGGNQVWGPQIFDGTPGAGHGAQVPVVLGFFNVILGPSDTISRSILAAFNGKDRYLEIEVGSSPPIIPRQQILSAPYAINAEKLGGGAVVVDSNNSNVGIGISNPSSKLTIARSIIGNSYLVGDAHIFMKGNDNGYGMAMGVINSPAGTFIQTMVNDAPSTLPLYLNPGGGNVGIGTTSPQASLHVVGPVKMIAGWQGLVPNTNYTAPSDGFVIGMIKNAGGGNYYIWLSGLVGGELRATASVRNDHSHGGQDSFTIPVAKGETWNVQADPSQVQHISVLFRSLGH